MKYFLLILMFPLFTACRQNPAKADFAASQQVPTPPAGEEVSYEAFLQKLGAGKSKLDNASAASAYLFDAKNKGIVYYWTGTPWDFNGVTRKPGQGSIACGYFITNVLSDLGFQIQRVKLAQKASSEMIKELTVDIERTASMKELKAYLAKQKANSVFIVGLDFHTGFILKTEDECYFFHANYINRQGVIKETTDESRALNSSKSFMIGNLTANKALLTRWIKS